MDVRIACLGVVALGWGSIARAQNVKVNEELARVFASDDVLDFRFSPDGARVVYAARRTQISSQVELFSRPVDASSPSLRLNGALASGGSVRPTNTLPQRWFLLAGSGRVAFVADENGDQLSEVYSAPVDGSTSLIQLSDPGARLELLVLDPAETRAVFKHTPTNSAYGSLHVVPLDGSAAPLRLGGSLTARKAWFAPDGMRVLFAAPDPRRELLYVVPADGSASPVLLDATPLAPIFIIHYLAFDDLVFTPAPDATEISVVAELAD